MTIDGSAIEEIATLAQGAAEAEMLERGKFYVFRLGQQIHKVDLTGDEHRDQPKRKRGTTVVRDVPSFLAVWEKHSGPESEIYADRDARSVTAVFDAHQPHGAEAGWGEHRAVLRLKHTDAFAAWHAINGQQLSQTRFAEFVEDRRADVREPAAADLLEMAQDFQATSKVTFRSGAALKSGQRQLTYVEQIDATSGKNGQLTIPDQLTLGVAVFEGATVADAITARLRYRIDGDGKLALIVVLDQLGDVINAAFEGVIAEVDAGVMPPILRGAPA